MIITIDGLSAIGKSTVSSLLAQELNIVHLTTGLFYRAIAYLLIKKNLLATNDLKKYSVSDLEEILDYKFWHYIFNANKAKFFLRNQDLTDQLKDPEIALAAGLICNIDPIRNLVNQYCRDYASKNSVIADGRDCGTVLFKNADFKFYLLADFNIRVQRWQKAMLKQNVLLTFEQAHNQLRQRDLQDLSRTSPENIPNDTYVIDTSNLSINEVIKIIKAYINC